MIPIGRMDRCVILQKATLSRETDGSYLKTWADSISARAAYNYKGGSEVFQADQETAIRTVKWTMRYAKGVDETYRLKHGSDLYDIINVELVGRDRYMDLHCIKKTVYQER